MELYQSFEVGTPEYVFYHGLHQIEIGQNPSVLLMDHYSLTQNPVEAFALAKTLVKDCSTEERVDTLFGRPFLRTEIDWEKRYQLHLAGPRADIPFQPQSGKDECRCSLCFYRDAPKDLNPKGDCQIGDEGDLAKKFFGTLPEDFLPTVIDGKEVGHYCPYWLSFMAE